MAKMKWSKYLLEFSMLFLAIYLGFLAENWREQLADIDKEKDYMHSLIADLKMDKVLIASSISYNTGVYKKDSILMTLLLKQNKDPEDLRTIYQLELASHNFDLQINDPKTFDQLKSTGDFRLIRNKHIADSITKYYQHTSRVVFFRDEIQNNLQQTYKLSFKIFDQYGFRTSKTKTAPLMTNDVLLLKEYTNNLNLLYESYRTYCRYLNELSDEAGSLVSIIENEYP